jgi:hypothetical protein
MPGIAMELRNALCAAVSARNAAAAVSDAKKPVESAGAAPRGLRYSAFRTYLGVFLGLAQSRDAVPRLPLAAFLEQFDPLKALEHISFAAQSGRRAQTPML